MIRDLGRARARRDEVANCLLEVAPKAIDEAGSLIIALVVDAMLQRPERVWAKELVNLREGSSLFFGSLKLQ